MDVTMHYNKYFCSVSLYACHAFFDFKNSHKKLHSQDGKRGIEMKILTGRRFNVEREYYTFLQKANRRFKIVLSTCL